jgi:hypothetical protein
MRVKRTGRPRLTSTACAVPVTIALPAKQYDRYCRQALRESVSVPEIIRRHLKPTFYSKTRHG